MSSDLSHLQFLRFQKSRGDSLHSTEQVRQMTNSCYQTCQGESTPSAQLRKKKNPHTARTAQHPELTTATTKDRAKPRAHAFEIQVTRQGTDASRRSATIMCFQSNPSSFLQSLRPLKNK